MVPWTSCWLQNAPKTVFDRGSIPGPRWGAYDAPPGPLVRWGGDTPSPHSSPSTPSAPRSRRLLRLGPTGVSVWNSFRRRWFVWVTVRRWPLVTEIYWSPTSACNVWVVVDSCYPWPLHGHSADFGFVCHTIHNYICGRSWEQGRIKALRAL